ncbi:methyltransferase domain-containing protein [Massilia sp. CF038]|uniref:spermine/spermidine synthase domain-containing protein n=1 Tax=Massilia sp. CF038 TaxID=1881045 RepID=UPI00091C4336|nr:methyltransferase domain-containing protein [Massilia sp. CF038]SHG42265.1 spermidine synthase [Massilia sp. CF038]
MLIKRKSIEQVESSRRPARTPKFAPVTLSEQDGVRYLHFGTEWVQGAMRIRKPDWPELEYAQQMMAWMLFIEQPRAIAQLGLGTGALTKFCYRQFADASVTAIELNPAVVTVCESMFKLPPNDARLNVVEMDAFDFVNDPLNAGAFDVLQCDLYDATAKGPVLDTPEFYQSCNACLRPGGMMTVNLFGDHPSFARNIKAMKFAFDHVICLPEVHDGNVVALCFQTRPVIDLAALKVRAAAIVAATKLPAKSWVKGLEAAI